MTRSNKSKPKCHVTWLVTLCRKYSEALTDRLKRRSQYDAEAKEVRSGNETICYRQAGGTDYLSAAGLAQWQRRQRSEKQLAKLHDNFLYSDDGAPVLFVIIIIIRATPPAAAGAGRSSCSA
jgi:hypothetical protein